MGCLYAIAFVFGVAQTTAGDENAMALLCSWSMGSAAALWATADARSRGNSLLHIVQVIIVFSWPVALPAYLVRSRGFRGILLACVHGAALFATYVGGFKVALAAQ